MYVSAIGEVESLQKKSRRESIYFTDDDLLKRLVSHRDVLVVAMDINGIHGGVPSDCGHWQ